MDVADEMGICVLNETANWASDGGPKLDSELFWEASKAVSYTHLDISTHLSFVEV